MVRYALLIKFTDKGVANVKDSPTRAAAFRAALAKAGGTLEGQYWLLGEYDGLAVFTAPDEQAATAAVINLASLGNVRTTLCRAFDEAEFKAILART
jgi:uncharacterized protein with GYD domain